MSLSLRSSSAAARSAVATLVLFRGVLGETEEGPTQKNTELSVTVRDDRRGAPDPGVASTLVPKSELRAPGATLERALRRVPGVEVTRTGAQSDFVSASLRGSTSAQTPIYLAGIRLNDEVGGAADLSLVPVWLLDRVEVYRGNAPEHAEELGVGGGIFAEPALPNRTELRGGLLVGSFGERAGFAVGSIGGAKSATTIAARTHGARNDYSYLHDNGTRFVASDDVRLARKNADFEELDVWAIQRLRGRQSRVTALVNALEREQGVTGLSLNPAEHARSRTRRLLVGVSAATACDGDLGRCELGVSTSAKLVREQLDDPFAELSAPLARFVDISGRRLSQSASLDLGLAPHLRLGVLGGVAIDTLSIDRRESLSINATRRGGRAGLSGRLGVTERWSIHSLLRGECHATEGPLLSAGAWPANDVCDVFEPTGRLGTLIEIARGLSVLGNIGRYVRPPTLGELYGTSPVVRGNPELETETAWSADVGFRLAHDLRAVALGLETFAFRRDSEDLIAYRRVSLGIVRPYNLKSARTLGVETALVLDAWRHLRAITSATLLDARDRTPDNPLRNDVLPLKSRLVLAPSVEIYTDDRYVPLALDGAALGVSSVYRSSRYADNAGLVVLEPQLSFDAAVTLDFFDGRLRFGASVENVLDAHYLDIIGLPLPGRTYHLSCESWW